MKDEPNTTVIHNNTHTAAPGQTPVDRSRRFWFVSRVVAFCLVASGVLVVGSSLGIITLGAVLVELYVSSLLSLATAISLAYIGGSVVDYNGGFGNMFTKKPDNTEPKG